MTSGDVDGRAELATYLGKEIWPAGAEELLNKATESNASDRVISQLRSLPGDQSYANVSEVWRALNGNVEEHRF
jgi:hypothetical protein